MAVQFNTKHSRTSEYRFLPEDIAIRPELNGRHDKPDIEWLIADILKNGQIQPVSIWSDAGTSVLAAGFSRWRAVSEINKRGLTPNPLELRCTYIQCNELGAFLRNISENRMRNDCTPVDDARNMQRCIEAWQMSREELVEIYFPTAATEQEIKKALAWIDGRISLIKLTPEAECAVRDGRLNETAAQAIAKLSSSQQREALKKADGKLTAKEIRDSAPKSNRGRKPGEKKVAIDVELRRRITAVLETADFANYDEKKSLWIEVHAEPLVALKNYIEEK